MHSDIHIIIAYREVPLRISSWTERCSAQAPTFSLTSPESVVINSTSPYKALMVKLDDRFAANFTCRLSLVSDSPPVSLSFFGVTIPTARRWKLDSSTALEFFAFKESHERRLVERDRDFDLDQLRLLCRRRWLTVYDWLSTDKGASDSALFLYCLSPWFFLPCDSALRGDTTLSPRQERSFL